MNLRIDTTSRIPASLSLNPPSSPRLLQALPRSPRLHSPLPQSPTFPSFPMPPHGQDATMATASLTTSCSLNSIARLTSVSEGSEVTSFPLSAFPPRMPSVTEGLFEYAYSDVGPDEAAFFNAAGSMDLKALEDLLDKGVDINFTCASINYRSVLHELVIGSILQDLFETHRKQHLRFIDMLTLLLHRGLDVNAGDLCQRSALHYAASYPAQQDMIKVLLASGAKANQEDSCRQTALHKAVTRAGVDDVQALLDGGAHPDRLDAMAMSPIHLAAKRKFHPEVLEVLLASGGNANMRDLSLGQRGGTPLHVAVKVGCLDNVRVLLARGAKVDLTDTSGQSAIHLAASNDLTGNVLQCLLRHGASINDQDATYRETPLHKAVKMDMIENFKVMVKRGANPNIKDDQNETVLHKAVSCTKPYIWMNLMKLGGDPDVRNRAGLSPMDKAARAKNHMAVSIMKEHTAQHS